MMDGINSLIICLFPLVSIYADPHALLDVCGGDTICKVYHELGKLLHVDDIPGICFMLGISTETNMPLLWIIGVRVNDLGASCYLKRLL